jgi:hypothetical protein
MDKPVNGKGDRPRPKSVTEEVFAKRFDDAFGHKPSWFETSEHKKFLEEVEKERREQALRELVKQGELDNDYKV